MSLEKHKITDNADTQGSHLGFASLPNTLAGSAEENKALFDEKVKEGIKPFINGLIDDLISPAAAAELGFAPLEGMDAETVQKAAEQLLEKAKRLDTAKANKVPEAKENNLASFDEDGNLRDSGFNPESIQKEIFTAEYGVTTGEEVFEAATSGKTVICKYTEQIKGEDVVLQIPSSSYALDTDEIRFTATTENRVIHIYVQPDPDPAWAWSVETHDREEMELLTAKIENNILVVE